MVAVGKQKVERSSDMQSLSILGGIAVADDRMAGVRVVDAELLKAEEFKS
jgi:hypothetical protein